MPMIQFSEKDLLRGRIVTPAWYLVRIDAVGEKTSKDGGSTNFPAEATIIKNAEDGSDEFANVPLDWNFNSKAMGFAMGFFKAFGIEPELGKRYDFSAFAGKFLQVFVENDIWEGRTINRVNHKYRPADYGVATT